MGTETKVYTVTFSFSLPGSFSDYYFWYLDTLLILHSPPNNSNVVGHGFYVNVLWCVFVFVKMPC